MRLRTRLTVALGVALLAVGCGATEPEIPVSTETTTNVVIYDDRNRSEVYDAGDRPIELVSVLVHDGFQTIAERADSDANGVAAIEAPAGTDVTVVATIPLDPADGSERPVPVEVTTRGATGQTTTIGLARRACPDIESCEGLLLPDLVALAEIPDGLNEELIRDYPGPDRWYLDTETRPGRTLLRIASLTANLGRGPLIVTRGAVTDDLSEATVFQRLVTADGAWFDIETGSFIHHEDHGHVHLEAFEQLRLLRPDGTVAAESEKLSFCLTDVLVSDRELVDTAPITVALEAWACSAYEQGINPGYADYYGPKLDDQWIDITGVEHGDYLVEFRADPDDVLLEADESNNVATLAITLDDNAPTDPDS